MKNPKSWAKKLERVMREAPDGLELIYRAADDSFEVWKFSEETAEGRTDKPIASFSSPIDFSMWVG